MAIDTALLIRLSSLLDEALDLPSSERPAWLKKQPLELRDELTRMLADQANLADGTLVGLPRLGASLTDAHPGERLGPYRLLEELGQGGMGSVWLAERADGAYERRVALKLPRRAWSEALAARLEREQRISARLEHAHIARLYDAGRDAQGRPFIAMEYVAGEPIDLHVKSHAPDLHTKLVLMQQVLGAVAYAHSQGVIHRDLKPSNVLIAADSTPRLLDFGIAGLLSENDADGSHTPRHAAPEQVAGRRTDARSDVYSLGVMLHQVLTGHLPEAGPPPRLPVNIPQPARRELEAILARALQPEQELRYGSAAEFAADLQAHLDGNPTLALPDNVTRALARMLRRHRAWAWATGIAAVVLFFGLSSVWRQSVLARASAEREAAARSLVSDVVRASAGGQSGRQAAQGLFQHSTSLIEQRFAGQPQQRAELYAAIGAVLNRMGASRLASDVGARQIDALIEAKVTAPLIAESRLAQARTLLDARDPVAAEFQARAAQQDAPSLSGRILLARALVRRLAVTEAQRVAQDIQAQQPKAMDAAWSLSLQAQLAALTNHRDDASRLHAMAVALAQQYAATAPLDDIAIELAAAEAAIQSQDRTLSDHYLSHALGTLHELGGEHRIREAITAAGFAAARFTAFFQISGDEALRVIHGSRTQLAALEQHDQPVAGEIAALLDLHEATVLARMNRNASAQVLLARSLPTLEAWARTPVERLRLGHTVGEVNEGLGRYAEADHGYQMALKARLDGGMGQNPMTAFQYSAAAENLAKGGHTKEALRLLDEAPRFEPARGEATSDPQRYNHLMDASRARILLDAGQAEAALQALPADWFHPGSDRVSQYDAQVVHAIRGEARCALQQWRAGAADLARSVQLARKVSADGGADTPVLARLLAMYGLCQWGAGNHEAAAELERQARTILQLHPEAAAYYAEPAQRLAKAFAGN